MVSVSRRAEPPQRGQATLTQSSALSSGDRPPSGRNWYPDSGNRTGSSLSGTGTSPHVSQWMMGIGVPQYRWRDSSQSRSRYTTAGSPTFPADNSAVIAAAPSSLDIPVNRPEPTNVPGLVVGTPVSLGSGSPVSTTARTGSPSAR